MSKSGVWQTTASLLAVTMCVGCFPTAKSQLARCQSEKKQLLSRVVDEQKRAEGLVTENRSLNDKLAEAETQLAKLHDGRGSRLAEFRRPPPPSSSSSSTAAGSHDRFAPDLSPADMPQPNGNWKSKQSQRLSPAGLRDDSSSR